MTLMQCASVTLTSYLRPSVGEVLLLVIEVWGESIPFCCGQLLPTAVSQRSYTTIHRGEYGPVGRHCSLFTFS